MIVGSHDLRALVCALDSRRMMSEKMSIGRTESGLCWSFLWSGIRFSIDVMVEANASGLSSSKNAKSPTPP